MIPRGISQGNFAGLSAEIFEEILKEISGGIHEALEKVRNKKTERKPYGNSRINLNPEGISERTREEILETIAEGFQKAVSWEIFEEITERILRAIFEKQIS